MLYDFNSVTVEVHFWVPEAISPMAREQEHRAAAKRAIMNCEPQQPGYKKKHPALNF